MLDIKLLLPMITRDDFVHKYIEHLKVKKKEVNCFPHAHKLLALAIFSRSFSKHYNMTLIYLIIALCTYVFQPSGQTVNFYKI